MSTSCGGKYDPKTLGEYVTKYARNENVTGFGLETKLHMPCPFCAEEDFAVIPVLEVQQILEQENVCTKCGRGMRIDYSFNVETKTLRIKALQTCGEDPAPYHLKMERVN